jgi:hypothetical protein
MYKELGTLVNEIGHFFKFNQIKHIKCPQHAIFRTFYFFRIFLVVFFNEVIKHSVVCYIKTLITS